MRIIVSQNPTFDEVWDSLPVNERISNLTCGFLSLSGEGGARFGETRQEMAEAYRRLGVFVPSSLRR